MRCSKLSSEEHTCIRDRRDLSSTEPHDARRTMHNARRTTHAARIVVYKQNTHACFSSSTSTRLFLDKAYQIDHGLSSCERGNAHKVPNLNTGFLLLYTIIMNRFHVVDQVDDAQALSNQVAWWGSGTFRQPSINLSPYFPDLLV